MIFSIVDIETTGDKPKNFKIIEIAIILHDGEKEIDRFHSFIDPEERISPFISRLTGISDYDVQGAPKFYELAKKIIEFTAGTIFVAHNVSFDYGVIRREYKRLGYDFRLDHMCTIQSARILIPGHASYGLKNITKDLDIQLSNHHRAIDDTVATAILFGILFKAAKGNLNTFIKKEIDPASLNPLLDINILDEIPNKIGVYKFYDTSKSLIYIGKSIHIKKRIEQHFKNTKTNKAIEMRERIAYIDHFLTGSELIALLRESEEIKTHQPRYNTAQRATQFTHGLYLHEDQNGYKNLLVKKNTLTEKPLVTFTSLQSGKKYLEFWMEEFELCQKLCHLYKTSSTCFNYAIKKCKGACSGLESVVEYNSRIAELTANLNFGGESFLIVDKGRTSNEFSFISIKDGQYEGYGYIYRYLLKRDAKNFKKFLTKQESNRDFQSIIKMQLHKDKKLEILPI
ncbi:exonuclease domain-containing protein [Crocinitomix sp.]|nr:exonuclease domain-containing protein [Crocinitomix sp.]